MRKGRPEKREIAPDPRYNDVVVAKFINNLMWDGKKTIAARIFYEAMDIIRERTGENELEIFKQALENVMPNVEVRSRRVGGATFQVPTEVRPDRRLSLGIKWLIRYARQRKAKGMAQKLAAELLAARQGEGGAVKKKEDTHRMAEANKAFAHFRF